MPKRSKTPEVWHCENSYCMIIRMLEIRYKNVNVIIDIAFIVV